MTKYFFYISGVNQSYEYFRNRKIDLHPSDPRHPRRVQISQQHAGSKPAANDNRAALQKAARLL